MARDQEPVTDAEIEAIRDAMREQREEIRDYLKGEDVDVRTWGRGRTPSHVNRESAASDQ
ncbi:hypothetical protein [Halomarina pelagica]|uniref:hypothetical protein n=1 Tax=Halomarina pelagica TaxID=2961599 RepID=UPI0020C385FF|nr:hypothetical protein [Halomarina sp. BND7]